MHNKCQFQSIVDGSVADVDRRATSSTTSFRARNRAGSLSICKDRLHCCRRVGPRPHAKESVEIRAQNQPMDPGGGAQPAPR